MRTGLSRRRIIQGSLALLAALGLPPALRAETGPAAAFAATDADEALRRLFGDAAITPSGAVALTLPLMVDNGANVPVEVTTTLDGVRSIALVVDRNPRPLAAWFELAAGMHPAMATRIKLGATSTVRAVVQTDAGLFAATADVTVTVGGCA
jgi:sulfur-oxidizing protein SoxY